MSPVKWTCVSETLLVVIPPCSIWQWYKVGEFSSSERKRATRARADGLAFRGFALRATRATPTKGYFMVDILR